MPLPMITADYSVGPAQQQYSTRSASVRESLPASTKASHHPNSIQLASSSENEMDSDSASVRGSLPASTKASHHPNSIQLASSSGNEMDSDYNWVQAMLNAGIPPIQIIGNILRWENPLSNFALLQAENSKIYAFDSGLGLCVGLYSYGEKVDAKDGPSWEELFTSYGVNDWVTVIRINEWESWDGEQRMVDYFSEKNLAKIEDESIIIVTSASPCREKCASLLAKWANKLQNPNKQLQYFAPYREESRAQFLESVNILQEKFEIMPVPLAYIDWTLFDAARSDVRKEIEYYLSATVKLNSYYWDKALRYNPKTKKMEIVNRFLTPVKLSNYE